MRVRCKPHAASKSFYLQWEGLERSQVSFAGAITQESFKHRSKMAI